MPNGKNNPSHPFVAKSGNNSRIVVETPGVDDETKPTGKYSDRIKYKPYTNLGPYDHQKMPMERT